MFGWKKKEKPLTSETADGEKAAAPAAVSDGLTVKVKDRAACSVVMSVEVPAVRVQEATEESYRRVQAKVKLPGFRPGKAPLDMVKKNFHDAAWEDAVDHLLRESIYDALTKEKVAGVSAPVVDKIVGEPGKPLRFELKVECAPEAKVKDYAGLPLVKKTPVPLEADIEKRLAEIRESHAKLVLSKDGTVEKKHFVVVDYESFLDGVPVRNGKATQQLIEMGAAQNVEGFTEGLLGAKDGETRDIPVKFPAEHPQKDLAGKTVNFKATVTAIKEKEYPVLDDEFAKDIGAKDLAEVKESVRKDLETGRTRAERQDLEKQVVDELLQRNVFDVPSSQVEERAKQLTERLKEFLKERGATAADWQAQEPKMFEKNRPEAERQVRLSYILGKILEQEKVAVSDEDVDAHIEKILGGARPDQRAEVETWMRSRRDNVKAQLREERLFDFLIQNAKITEAPASEVRS